MRAEKIVAIKKIGIQRTMDITVDSKEHIFYGNGIATSNSHSISYGDIGWMTAYVKQHFPLHFYTSWLYYAKDKQYPKEEIEALVDDAITLNVDIFPPSMKYYEELSKGFSLINGNIYFGIPDVKKIGLSLTKKMVENIKSIQENTGVKIQESSWYKFIIHYADSITSSSVINLIMVGAFDYMRDSVSRSKKVFEFNLWNELTSREKSIAKEIKSDNLLETLSKLEENAKISEKRRSIIRQLKNSLSKDAAYSTDDTHYSIVLAEEELLGVPITCKRLDNSINTGDTSCKELNDGKTGKCRLTVEIIGTREYIIKKAGKNQGRKMLYLKVRDESGVYNSVVAFPDTLDKFQHLLYKRNIVNISGNVDPKRKEPSLTIEEVSDTNEHNI